MRGGEKVLECLVEMFPEADVHTLVTKPEKLSLRLRAATIHTSLLQKIPGGPTYYPWLLVFHPLFFRQLKVAASTSLFLCSDASFAKAIRAPADAVKVCYCHSPPRYLWGHHEHYLTSKQASRSLLLKSGLKIFGGLLRSIDKHFAQDFDLFIANSKFVADRISRCYGKESIVVHPPVDIDRFNPSRKRGNFFLIISQLEPYKRIDLVIDAFRNLDDDLVVVGEGSQLSQLQKSAPKNVSVTGRLSDTEVTDLMERTSALIFPGEEDFGLTPVEANAAGAPVIAYKGGGALETIIPGKTGLFFAEHSTTSIIDVIREFQRTNFSPDCCRRNSEKFHKDAFVRNLGAAIENQRSQS